MEALVALRERLPVVFAVFNDGRYNMVYHGFRSTFGREAPWSAPRVDFALWAESMGMSGLRVDASEPLTPERFDRAMTKGGPIVLDICIDADIRLKGAGRVESLQRMSGGNGGAQ
jgi:acetolactate synthase-1/2/3 large subunit